MGRTKALLHQALLSLLAERRYESITVQDILDKANVGRSTFYAHYRDKEDLLLSGMEPLRTQLLETVRASVSGRREEMAFVSAFFVHADGYREPYRSIVDGGMGMAAEQLFFSMLVELFTEELKQRKLQRAEGVSTEGVAHALAGALMGLIAWWTNEKRPLSADRMSDLFIALTKPGIRGMFAARS